ncbi:MAG: DUF1887 family protein [Clostridia bacterium]|nr:DUF1887 family protein [Clostridia bacterium]
MTVVFEFLGKEEIENLVTSMNYAVDKVVYFGSGEAIAQMRDRTSRFLAKYCGVAESEFVELPSKDLPSVLAAMKRGIVSEKERGNDLFFDITGGESLVLVAFGMLSREFRAPLHMFDIESGRLIELTRDFCEEHISGSVKERRIPFDLDMFIEMKGGVINYRLHKRLKDTGMPGFDSDLPALRETVRKSGALWNSFSEFMRGSGMPDGKLFFKKSGRDIDAALAKASGGLKTRGQLDTVLNSLAAGGLITGLIREDGGYEFSFKNEQIKGLVWESGSVLELYTYSLESAGADDCRVGVHLDWDGRISPFFGKDVLNEVDVLSLRGYVPTFISCKGGRMGPSQSLHALYELETVAERFGGKYAKKVLVSVQPLSRTYAERAKEMDIEVRSADGKW